MTISQALLVFLKLNKLLQYIKTTYFIFAKLNIQAKHIKVFIITIKNICSSIPLVVMFELLHNNSN